MGASQVKPVQVKKSTAFDCTLVPVREQFEKDKKVTEAVLVTFKGIDGYDVYNSSVPFTIGGVRHIYGRVEKRDEWVNSTVRLFKETGKDEFTLVPTGRVHRLEDPYISKIKGEMVLGGTHVVKNKGKCCNYFCDFYRGSFEEPLYFTSGPQHMKDIRLIELADGRIGIFSHHKSNHECLTGFFVIDSLDDLSSEAIDAAVPIDHEPFGDAWGGVNQAYLLDTGKIGCISHHGYLKKSPEGETLNVYCCTSFVFEPSTNKVYDFKVLATVNCWPNCPVKATRLVDCVFVSGITMRKDGKADLYSGVGDTHVGRLVIDYPFEGHGAIADNLDF